MRIELASTLCLVKRDFSSWRLWGCVAFLVLIGGFHIVTGSASGKRGQGLITDSLGIRIMGVSFLIFAICVSWYLLNEFRGKKMKPWEIDTIIFLVVVACFCAVGGIFFAVVN
jgi:hypothetical protein